MTSRKTAYFDEFKAYTIAVARGDQAVDPTQPKIWVEPAAGGEGSRKIQARKLTAIGGKQKDEK